MDHAVGRERELSLAEEFLESSGGRFAALLLEGDPGIGKTTVWREVLRRAEERRFCVLSCRPVESEAKLGLSAVADLLEPVPDAAFRRLPAPQRLALDVALLRAAPSGAASDRRTVATAVRMLLGGLAAQGPVLVAVDDVQWLDSASAAVLSFVLRRLGPERIGFLATRRLSELGALALDDVLRGETAARATVGPLSLGALHGVLKGQLGSAPARSLLVRIHKVSGGNPLFALEVARLLDELGIPPVGEPLPVPADVQALVERRITKLPAETRETLLAAAVLAVPENERIRLALGRSVDRDLEPAERERIARFEREAIVFEHPLYAAAILATAPAVERRRIHGRLAAVVDTSEERARHLGLSVEGRDEATAAAAQAAAREALLRGAPAAAAELAELAVRRSVPGSEPHQERLVEFAEVLFTGGEAVRAREVLEAVQSFAGWPPGLQARAVARLCGLVTYSAPPTEAIAFLEQLLRDELASDARAAVYALLSYSTSEIDAVRAAEHADEALALLGDHSDPEVSADVLYMAIRTRVILGRGLDNELVEALYAAEERLSPERRSLEPASTSIAYWLRYVDQLEAGRTTLESKLQAAIDGGREASQSAILAQLANTECLCGDLASAHEHALSAVRLAEELRLGYMPSLLAAQALALVEAHLGNTDAVRALAEQSAPSGATTWHGTILFAAARGLVELSAEHYETADRLLSEAISAAERIGRAEPRMHRMHANAAEAAVALGDQARAARIADLLEEHGRRTGSAWSLAMAARVRALVSAARGDLESALADAELSLHELERLPMPFERARTLLVKGAIERRLRRRADARRSFLAGLEIFDGIGARLWAERARAELERLGLTRSAGPELTEGERRVAELAARGLTNREVAALLFLSPKTVEANLARAYRKLGIKSRAELGARMAELVQT
jgi:DNA-binding CsgD family transcriptional regulator